VEAIRLFDIHEARFDNYGSSSYGFDKLSAALYALVAVTDAKVYDTNRAPYRNVATNMLRGGKSVALASRFTKILSWTTPTLV
jgi:hypothetical protein